MKVSLRQVRVTLALALIAASRSAFALDCSSLKDPTALAKWWREGQFYFKPEKSTVSPVWIGTVYLNGPKTCCSIKETDDGLLAKPMKKCPAGLKEKASIKAAKIKDFGAFKAKFADALAASDRGSLKSMMLFDVRAGFGFDVYGDLREQALQKWGSAGLKRMRELLKKGTVGSGAHRSFPPAPDHKGLGWRGTFVRADDGWFLESFFRGQ